MIDALLYLFQAIFFVIIYGFWLLVGVSAVALTVTTYRSPKEESCTT